MVVVLNSSSSWLYAYLLNDLLFQFIIHVLIASSVFHHVKVLGYEFQTYQFQLAGVMNVSVAVQHPTVVYCHVAINDVPHI